jgi:XTP/dITP diphosphohydrolase
VSQLTRIYCATTNPGKLREFQLGGLRAGFDVQPLPGLSALEAPEETGVTFAENAAIKAIYYSRFAAAFPVFVDDSGLAVEALGGAPGVWSARYAGPDADDDANNRLVLERMHGKVDRRARFVCVIALAQAGELLETFEGVVEGELLDAPRGTGGFGYDPLFYYPPLGCTTAEATAEQKLSISHRGHALEKLFTYLATEVR